MNSAPCGASCAFERVDVERAPRLDQEDTMTQFDAQPGPPPNEALRAVAARSFDELPR